MLPGPENEHQPDIVNTFHSLFEIGFNHEKGKLKGEAKVYPQYRALDWVLYKSRVLESQPLEEEDLNSLVSYLLGDETYSPLLKDWIRVRKLDWERKSLTPKALDIYSTTLKLMQPQPTL